jgi:putative photosynthetic complex assembly protein
MSDIFAHNPVPRTAVIAAALLVAVTVVAAVAARWTDVGTLRMPEVAAAASVDLTFTDRADGAVVVEGGGAVTVLDPGTNGFVRGVLRGLARDRRARGIGAETPFRLVQRVDGRLALEDPATGRTLDLGAFGPTNAGAFARFLHHG